MSTYLITATKHDDPKTEGVSKFKLWTFNPVTNKWRPSKGVTKKAVVDLIQSGHVVKTAEEGSDDLSIGAPVKIVLRVAENNVGFPIDEMPEY